MPCPREVEDVRAKPRTSSTGTARILFRSWKRHLQQPLRETKGGWFRVIAGGMGVTKLAASTESTNPPHNTSEGEGLNLSRRT